jgi:hypothetical protein
MCTGRKKKIKINKMRLQSQLSLQVGGGERMQMFRCRVAHIIYPTKGLNVVSQRSSPIRKTSFKRAHAGLTAAASRLQCIKEHPFSEGKKIEERRKTYYA